MSPSYFTPEQANALLPEVRPLAERMADAAAALADAEAHRAQLLARIAGNGGDLPPSELADATERVEAAEARVARSVGRLLALGVQVKDPRIGLVDFPALRGEEEVLLCWRLGEEEVGFWHGLDEGYAGRKALPFDG